MSLGATSTDRPYTHELLDDIPPLSALKEKISKAVVAMVASSAGLTLGTWDLDYDAFDVTVSSSHDYSPFAYGPKLDLQMKCTGQQSALRDDHLAWSLDVRTIEKLSSSNRHTMAALCVVVVPEHPGHWLEWPDGGLFAYCQAYFLRGQDLPAVSSGQATHTVQLPYANVLTAPALLGLMEQAARWRCEP